MGFVGDGKSIETAIKFLGIRNNFAGVMAEYRYLDKKFGKRGVDWELEMQAIIEKNGRYYDELTIVFPDGTKETIYFDITLFLGKHGKGGCLTMGNEKQRYAEGYVKIQVSDIEKGFEIIQKYNVAADISTKDKTIEMDLESFSSIEKLISVLQELKPICVPLRDPFSDLLDNLEDGDEESSEE